MEHTHCLMESPAGILKLLIGIVEASILQCTVGKSLGGADTGKAAFDLRIDMGGLLLTLSGCLTHIPAHGHDHHQKYGDHQRNHYSQLPADGDHNHQRTNNGQNGGHKIFRAVVGKLRQFKEVRSQPAHKRTGAVTVIKVEAQLLHMAEQIPTDVRFYPDAEGMTVVGNDKVQR